MTNLKIYLENAEYRPCWVPEALCETDNRRSWLFLLPFTAVVIAHVVVFAIVLYQRADKEITLASTAPPSSVRINMVTAPQVPPTQIVPPQPLPPVITVEKAERTVAQEIPKAEPPKPTPKPVPKPKPKPIVKSVEPKPTENVKPTDPIAVPSKPTTQAPSENQEKLMDLPSAGAKDVQTVGCRVPAPDYPRQARRLKIEGNVLVTVLINAQGLVQSASVARSSGNEELDEAARRTVMSAACSPYIENGRAIAVRAAQPVSFRLTR